MPDRGFLLPGQAVRDLQEVATLVLGSTRTRRARRRHRRNAGGGGGGIGPVTYGVVVGEAAANGGSAGAYVALDKDMVPINANGETVIIDEGDPEFDEEALNESSIPFYSAHVYAPCPVGCRVRVQEVRTVRDGATDTEPKTWGELVDVLDYLATRPNFAEKKVLFVPDGGDAAEDIDWYGAECEE